MATSKEVFDFVSREIQMASANARIRKILNENFSLNLTQLEILKKLLEGKNQQEIANEIDRSSGHVNNEIREVICPLIITALFHNGRIPAKEIEGGDSKLKQHELVKRKLFELTSASSENGLRIANSAYIQKRCGSLDIVYLSLKTRHKPPENEESKLQIEYLYVEQKLRKILPGENNISQFDTNELQTILDSSKSETSLKWMVYGRSGCGKTSLLKYLAVKCDKGEFQTDRIPIYISLKRYINHISKEGQQSILTYLVTAQNDFVCKYLERNELENQLKSLLCEGKTLILLDGLDVPEDESSILADSVRNFIDWCPANSFIISSRRKQSSLFDDFQKFELQNLNDDQKITFITKHFNYCNKDEFISKSTKAQRFNELLEFLNREHIKYFVCTPLLLAYIFLAYICLAESDKDNLGLLENEKIDEEERELLLCKLAIFELLKWDDNPDMKHDRDEIYLSMSVKQRADFLAKLAIKMIEIGKEEYVNFSELVTYSAKFLFPVSKAENKEELRIKSEQFLLAIEAQDGLLTRRILSQDPEYSFPHQTVKDFFAAWCLSDLSADEQLSYWESHVKLADKTTKERWQNIFQKTLIIIKIKRRELDKAHDQLQEKLIHLKKS